jgi:hypothetical protein
MAERHNAIGNTDYDFMQLALSFLFLFFNTGSPELIFK